MQLNASEWSLLCYFRVFFRTADLRKVLDLINRMSPMELVHIRGLHGAEVFSPISNPPHKVGSKSIPPQIKKLMGHPSQSTSK